MINFLKMAKLPRIGLLNAKRICFDLNKLGHQIKLFPTPWYGELMLRPNQADFIAFEQVFRYNCYGVLETKLPIFTVIDAGANIGLSSVYFSKRLDSPHIVGLEPEKGNFNQAILNTQAFSNIEMLNAALWHKMGAVRIANLESSGALGFQVEESVMEDNSVPALTVKQIMDERSWEHVDLLKIDIEGAELELFTNSSYHDWLDCVRITVIELHDWMRPGCSLPFFKAIATMDNIEMAISGENLIIINNNIP